MTFDGSATMLMQIFTDFHPELFVEVVTSYKNVFLLVAFGFLTHFIPDSWQGRIVGVLKKSNVVVCALLITMVIYIVIQVKSSTIQPFIYFQF